MMPFDIPESDRDLAPDIDEAQDYRRLLYYRGCSRAELKGHPFPLWLTPDAEYAKTYLTHQDDVLVEYELDKRSLTSATEGEVEHICRDASEGENQFDFDPYDPAEETLRLLLGRGYNCYEFVTSDYNDVLVLLDESPILSKSILE